ncbi:MAG: leucine-rich repeat protein [Kiritimatiellae bacterium]|nr:leucine-rich repeat protein [Kiritimatiellia bacterium]
MAFRDGGMAYVPVTIASGSRAQNFSIDWEAVDGTARFGEDHLLAGGTVTWTNTSQGTKTLQIPIATDHVVGETTSFRLRITVCRACNPSGAGECTVTIRELDKIAFEGGTWTGSGAVRFDGRDSIGGRILHGTERIGEPDGSPREAWNTAEGPDGWRPLEAEDGTEKEMLFLNAPGLAVEGGRLAESTTWDASATHLVRHWVVVPDGKTLTVGAGAVVKICPDAGIKVEDGGKLSFAGVDGADAIVTTADDDSAGVPIPAGPEDAGVAAGTAGRILFQSGNAAFADNGWFQVRGVGFSPANYGTVSVHPAEASRKSGTAYVAVTVGGNARNQGFAVDWEAVPGTATFGRDYKLAGGRLTWGKSSEGTKWIAIPLNTRTVAGARRKFKVRLAAVHGMAGSGKEATVEIREYEEGTALSGSAGNVVFSGESEASPPFAVDEAVWKEPMFRHDEEPIRLSGAWQGAVPAADTTVRLSWSGENGSGILAEVPGGTPATYTWRRSDWPVGSYVLKHEILSADGRRLAGLEKTFAVPDWAGVELHGGTVRSNETWRAGIVHVVYETVYVPALYTLMIEPGAIVKFLTGTGITIESGGGALFANGVVFTHINDDTVGGDTLNDGAASPPVMDAYTFRGNLTIGEESELRYKTQTPLSGTVSASRKLTRGSVYRVSGNVTVASGATLTIPAGTVLKFDQGVQMTVNSGGTLLANGTRAAPVVFTSVKDDDHGGDTNGDGDATYPVAGDWTCIKIAGGTARFTHSSILYSSRNQTTGAINMTGGTVVFDSGEIAHGRYDAVGVESGSFFMTNAVIRDCLLAFRHWAKDPIVNCVVYDCGRLTQGGGQTFVNCAFSGITETWEAFGFPKSTYRNCCFWNEGGSVLTAEGTQDALDICGQDGNVWGDPRFRDPDNGDFRILEGSACIDTADSAAAPETDVYGQKRWTWDGSAEGAGAAADIGVAECIPRGAASDVDLVAVSVACDRARAKPGETVFLHWTVANEGGEAVDSGWWDELSLVSATGRVIPLGEKLQGSRIEAGGVVTGTGYFVLPPLSEGVYGIRLHANCRRDVAEGTRTANNVAVADAALEIEVVTADAAEGAAGMLAENATLLRKFELGEGRNAQLCRVTAPAGTVVRFGLGLVPAAGVGGETTVDESGLAVFAVPEGTEAVYVVLEAGSVPGAFDVVFEDGTIAVSSVAPENVPRTGRATLRISGAGFGEDATLRFVASGGAPVAPVSLVRENAETLWATVDCATLAAAGKLFAVRVESSGTTATLPSAFSVTGAEGRGRIWARLDVPKAVRLGGRAVCAVEYGNDGNADLPAHVLQIKVVNGGALRYAGSARNFTDIHFVAATSPQGTIPAGASARIPFVLVAGAASEIRLYVASPEDGDALSLAAGTVWARGGDMNDYRLVANELSEETAIGSAACAEYRSCFPNTGEAVSLRIEFGETAGEALSVTAKNLETAESYMPVSMEDGIAAFAGLPAGTYRITAESGEAVGTAFVAVGASPETVALALKRKLSVAGTVENASEDDIVVFIGEESSYYATIGSGGTYAASLPAGIYDTMVMSSSGTEYDLPEDVEIDGDTVVDFAVAGTEVFGASASSVPTRTDYDDSVFENKYTQAWKRISEGMRLLSLAHAAYVKPTGEYDCPHNREIYADNYRTAEVFRFRLQTFMKNARMADPYKALALLGKSVHDTARAYLDHWLASKAKMAGRRFHKWAGGIFSAKQKLAGYVFTDGLDLLEAQIGSFETDVQSLQYLVEHRELSVEYVTQVLDKIAAIKDGFSGIKDHLDALAAAGTILHSDVEAFESDLFSDQMWDCINLVSTIAELVSDWMKTGEAGGEWLAGRTHIDAWMAEFEAVMRDFAAKLPPRPYLLHCCDMQDSEDIAGDSAAHVCKPDVPQSIDPNEVVGPAGVGDAETERFVEPGEWLDYTIYFENATNASAAAMQVRVTEELDPRLDWDTLELGEVVFANVTDLGLAGKSGGTSECAVPGADYTVRTSFSLHNGIATWHLRMVDPDGDEDGWPTDPYAGFLPPNDGDHNGEGHVSYRIKVCDDAPKNVRVTASADIVFDWNEAIPTAPSWWNRVGHLPVELAFDRNCEDTVVGMPRNGAYACDAPPFASPVREGWVFEGWTDADGVARNCGADLPYGTASLALSAQWREEVATRFATIAVEGGVAVTGFAEGQECPEDLVIQSSLEVGGRRLKVVGVADDAFAGQRALATLSVAEGVRWIGARAFRNCTQLSRVSLPSTLERIGEGAFYGCHLLAEAELAAAVPPEVGTDAFRGVAASGTLAVPEGAEEAYGAWVGSMVGSAWNLSAFRPGESGSPSGMEWVFWAGEALLAYFDGADEVRWAITTAPDGAEGRLALVRASGEGELPLPEAVEDENGRTWRITAIGTNDADGEGVFEALAVSDAAIPESVERIAPYAFANCAGLTNVSFAGSAPALRDLGDGAFFACTALRSVNLEAARRLERLGSEDAPLGMFESCWRLEVVALPPDIAGIGAYAFQDCSRLRSAGFADGGGAGVEWIGARAFSNCDLLSEVDTAAMVSLVRVGAAAFGGDTAATAPKISRVTLHRAVASLGDGAFLNAGMLSDIACFAPVPPERGADAFRGVAPTGTLRTREEAAEDYAVDNASGWIGEGGAKLPRRNGATGWQVAGVDAGEELRERNGTLGDDAFEALLAEAAEWGFTADELCEVVSPAGRMAPRVRILSWEGTEAPVFAVSAGNGIDATAEAAWRRLDALGRFRFAVYERDDLTDGEEREIPCVVEDEADGTLFLRAAPPEAEAGTEGVRRFWRVGMTARE